MSNASERESSTAVARDITTFEDSIRSDASCHSFASWTLYRGADLEDRLQEESEGRRAEEVSAEATRSNEAPRCNTQIRRPKVADNVQVRR